MQAKHLIYNASSPHRLLFNYYIRELGVVKDDVSKRHLRDVDTHGTHSIKFSNGHIIDLKTRGALPTFSVSKPTIEEYLNAPKDDIVNIAFEHWNPQSHHEDQLKTTPPVNITFNVTTASDQVATTIVTFMLKFIDADEDPYAAFMDCKEDLFHDAEEDHFHDSIDTLGKGIDNSFHDVIEYDKAFHLSLDYLHTHKGIKGRKSLCHVPTSRVNSFLSDIDY